MSDNTNLHHWLWANGIASFYGGSSHTTVAVFRCVVALPLSVMPWVAGDVTFRHLLSAAAGCPVPAASSRAL